MGADQTVDVHFTSLTDAMAPILCLCVHGGVPVAVVEHNRVSTSQVDADATAARGQNKAEYARIAVETVHEALSLVDFGGAVESKICVPLIGQELFLRMHCALVQEDKGIQSHKPARQASLSSG